MDPESENLGAEQMSQLLDAWASKDPEARDRLVPIVYAELRRLAHHYMKGERAGHTLQTTALVNEMYLRLAGLDRMQWRDRSHFIAMAATLMRRILVDYARRNAREKRGGAIVLTSLDGHDVAIDAPASDAVDVVELDDALVSLSEMDPRQGQVVELRFFGGLTIEETAEALDVSPGTVKREWATAKLWLHHRLSKQG